MNRQAQTPSLQPFTEEMYLSVIPGRWRSREKLHKRLGDARGTVTQHIAQPWVTEHLGAAIFRWDDRLGEWDCVDEILPGPRGAALPWQK